MLKDKLRETDWEITDEAINEQVARESYTQWLEDCQKQKRRAPVGIKPSDLENNLWLFSCKNFGFFLLLVATALLGISACLPMIISFYRIKNAARSSLLEIISL